MPKKTKQPAEAVNEAQTSASDIYDLSLNYLRKQIEEVIKGKAAKTKHDPAYRVATLTRMVAQVDGERRKARAAEDKRLDQITQPLVLAWARRLSDDERNALLRAIAAIGQKGNILS